MRSLPVFGLGFFFVLAGVAMFAVTFLTAKATESARAPAKKSELRHLEAQRATRQADTRKFRIGGAVCVAIGATLMVLS